VMLGFLICFSVSHLVWRWWRNPLLISCLSLMYCLVSTHTMEIKWNLSCNHSLICFLCFSVDMQSMQATVFWSRWYETTVTIVFNCICKMLGHSSWSFL
jgi:hypothetical protein